MSDFEVTYGNALIELDRISQEIQEDLGFEIDISNIGRSESTLDVADYCYTFLFGFLGAIISTNRQLKNYLADIHKAASEGDAKYDKFQILMGKLLQHKGDHIDKMIKRDGSPTHITFHRLFWGHDILSCGEDNPFRLMINQKGSKLEGIIQALRHLIADTMSKQGLPAPGSSNFDYINDSGKTSNYIIDLANNLSIEAFDNKAMAQEIYAHLFTIRAQDIAGGVLAKILTEVYFKIRRIDDKFKKAQMLFMVYAINFFTEALIGTIRQNGVPYINLPIGVSMMTAFAKFCYLDTKETHSLINKVKTLTTVTDRIIDKYEYHSFLFSGYFSADEMEESLDNSEYNMGLLINFLNGEKNE